MGGRQVGRSEPAFLSGRHHRTPSTNLHCTARGRPTSSAAVVLLRGLYQPDRQQLFCFKACAGRIVRRLRLPAAALFCRLCLPDHLCHAIPTALLIVLAPFILLFPPCSFHVRQDRRTSCTDCPVGSYNAGLQWRPVRRFLTFDFFFFLQSP